MDKEPTRHELHKQFARRIIFNIAIFKAREMEINSIGILSTIFLAASIAHLCIPSVDTRLCAIATFVSIFCSVINLLLVTYTFRTSTDLLIRTKREYMEGGPHVVPTGWFDVIQWFFLVVNAASVLVQYEQLIYG
jgi:hypothetical protein